FVVTGATPAGANGGYEQMERNLEALTALLGVRHRLMPLQYTAGSLVRVTDVTITSLSEPEINSGAARAKVVAIVEVPGVLWRDAAVTTWAGSPNSLGQTVTTLTGSTGPITDALIRITGPAGSPQVGDVATGGWVLRSGSVAAGQRLLFDCKQMRAALVTTDTWDVDNGTAVTGQVDAIGPGSAFRWLHLTPTIAPGDPFTRTVKVSSAATGTNGSSLLEIRAARSYL
ncbi:hypothetical protein, partial [Planotetraspora phitsanulokensis]